MLVSVETSRSDLERREFWEDVDEQSGP
jgi:hypothetical protein